MTCWLSAGTVNVQDSALVSWFAAQPVADGSGRRPAAAAPQEFGISVASHPFAGPRGWAFAFGRSWGPRIVAVGLPAAEHWSGTEVAAGGAHQLAQSPTAEQLRRGDSGGAVDGAGATAGCGLSEDAVLQAGSDGHGNGSIGSGGGADIGGGGGGGEPPWIAEASLQLPLGEGLVLSPGLVAVCADGDTTFALAARAQWAF